MKVKEGFAGERYLVIPEFIVDMMRKDPLLSSLHITDIGYYPKARHHYCERTEPISQFVLIYCVDGKGFYNLNGKKWTIEAGQYFIIPPNAIHSYGSDLQNPWTIYWIHFGGTLAPQYAADAAIPKSIEAGATSRIRQRHDLFEELYNILDAGLTIENLRYSGSLFHHYLGSLRFIQQYRGVRKDAETDAVQLAIHYMSENLERHVSLKEIATNCRLSESRLSALFRERTGHSILNYFNLLKIRRACELLDNTTLKLNQICFKVGIPDPYYFSRLFTKIMGMSPLRFRQRTRT